MCLAKAMRIFHSLVSLLFFSIVFSGERVSYTSSKLESVNSVKNSFRKMGSCFFFGNNDAIFKWKSLSYLPRVNCLD